jgi:hypothetical protein
MITHNRRKAAAIARRRLLAASLCALAVACVVNVARADTAYFVVAEIAPYHHDSYVLPLNEPDHIAHARELIKSGPGIEGGHIAVAAIAAGSDGINRNTLVPGQPLWSWHVSEFYGFAEMTIELCDGWPGLVEDNVDYWVLTVGQVCFWSYTVIEEITPDCDHNGYLDCDANGVPDECECLGDLDGNGFRNLSDFVHFADAYGSHVGDPDYTPKADLNCDGHVNLSDFVLFAGNYLSPCD